jgi:hypothetical protein
MFPLHDVPKNSTALKKRVTRLLRLDGSNNSDPIIREIIPTLKETGHIALIGGAIRDLAMAGRRGFKSDLDFVAYGKSRSDFSRTMNKLGGCQNSFGGYGLQFGVWKVDIWHLQDTWAKVKGIKKVDNLDDLLECTFFDWDSIVFDIDSNKLLHSRYYLNRLKMKIIDIKLEHNPNPRGSLIRSIRRAAIYDARFGPRLTRFAISELSKYSWDSLVDIDSSAFTTPILRYLDRERIHERLNIVEVVGNIRTTRPAPRRKSLQIELPLSTDDHTNLSSL